MTYMAASDQVDGVLEITSAYLRERAAHYRELITTATNGRATDRYRELSRLLDEEADSLERHPTAGRGPARRRVRHSGGAPRTL